MKYKDCLNPYFINMERCSCARFDTEGLTLKVTTHTESCSLVLGQRKSLCLVLVLELSRELIVTLTLHLFDDGD